MSGPKLSAYELECMRLEALEREKRELAAIHARIIEMADEVGDMVAWCDGQLLQLERQLGWTSSAVLPEGELASVQQAISLQKECIQSLRQAGASFSQQQTLLPKSLPEARERENSLRTLLHQLQGQKSAAQSGVPGYRAGLEKVAASWRSSGRVRETVSFEEAMLVPPGAESAWGEPGGETAAVRENLLHRIAALTQHQRITPGMKKRLAQAAQLAEQAHSVARLWEIDSLVVKEIAADLGEIEKKHGEYRRVRSENLALRAALGEKLDAGEERFEKPADMQRRINALRSDNQALTQRVLKAAERAEIAHAVDVTMAAMGYSLIGSKDASAEGTVKLYSFSNGTGIQVIHRADGIIRMKVVGLATPGHALDAADQAYLLTQQRDFCNAYESIVDALDKQGIRQVKGTVRALPPSAQFSQCVDVLEYDPHFLEAPQSGKRRAVNRPIQLTEGNG